jgi:predicted Zn-dependent peptidase
MDYERFVRPDPWTRAARAAATSLQWSAMDYQSFELANGLRVLAAPMPAMRSVSAAVLVGVGSRYEKDLHAGAAHLIEHLMFKGTPSRPTSRAISETIDRIGGVMNASTDKETTVYWTKTAAEHLPISIDLLSDMLRRSLFRPKDIAKERDIIVEELGMSMDDPQDWVHNLVDEAMWPDHPLGRDVGGTKESVGSLRRIFLHRYMTRYYGANNALLVVAGGIDPGHVHQLAERHFSGWEKAPVPAYVPAPTTPAPPSTRLQHRPTEQVHICLAFPGLSRYSPDRYALDVLATILGGSTSSRLFLEVRERLALAYDVHVYTTRLADTGSVVIYAGVDPRRASQAVTAIRHEIDRLRRRSVSIDELARTTDYMKGRMYLGLEDTQSVASWLGSQALLLDRIISPEELAAAIERVTPKDLRRLAVDLLDPALASLAAIGPNVADVAEAAAA